jgi:hypothetical protein
MCFGSSGPLLAPEHEPARLASCRHAVVGAPRDITVAELAIESFYPADAQTADSLHAKRRSPT